MWCHTYTADTTKKELLKRMFGSYALYYAAKELFGNGSVENVHFWPASSPLHLFHLLTLDISVINAVSMARRN